MAWQAWRGNILFQGGNMLMSEALHASAPEGHRCADCQIDGEPCPECYAAWWQKRHPNVVLAEFQGEKDDRREA